MYSPNAYAMQMYQTNTVVPHAPAPPNETVLEAFSGREFPKPFNPQGRNLNPLQPRHALTPPPIYEIVAFPHNECPFRQCPPRILRSSDFLRACPTFCRIPWSNLTARTRDPCTKPSLGWSRKSWRTDTTFITDIEARSSPPTANSAILCFIKMLAPLQAELKRECSMCGRCGRRSVAVCA